MSTVRRSEPVTPRRAAIERSVLGATEELLREGSSYSDLNIERIATRAGLSRTAFYFYFRDKRELLMRVVDGVADLFFDESERWWSGEGDGAEELGTALSNVSALWERHFPLLRAVVEAATFDEEIAAFWRGLVGRFIEATQLRIESEQAAGRAPADLDAHGVAFTLVWMTERVHYQRLTGDGEDMAAALRAAWLGAIYRR